MDVTEVKGDPVIAGGHIDIINTLNLKRNQVNLVRPPTEIHHGVRSVPGTEHEDVGTGTACQSVITRPADEGIITLPAEQPVIAKASGHHIVPAARAAVLGIACCVPTGICAGRVLTS